MKCLNDKYEICLAQPPDSEQLLALYECGDFKGDVSVLYTRRPDPIQSLMNEGERAVIPIVRDLENDVIVGMGACIIRSAYINGEVRTTGYLTGLKGLPNYRKRVPAISQTYSYLHDETKADVDLYYTTILKENTAVQKMLEKKRKGMPEYRRIGEYTVYSFRTGVKTKARGWTLQSASRKELESLDIWNPESFNFTPADTALHGLRDKAVYILKDPQGKAAAACALWSQKDWKQYIVTGYGGIFRWLNQIPLKWTGYPDLPKAGVPVNYAAVTLLTVREGDLAAADHLIAMVSQQAAGYDFLMLGLFANHPLRAVMEKRKSIKYRSILYTVHWEDSRVDLDDRPVSLEIGLL